MCYDGRTIVVRHDDVRGFIDYFVYCCVAPKMDGRLLCHARNSDIIFTIIYRIIFEVICDCKIDKLALIFDFLNISADILGHNNI